MRRERERAPVSAREAGGQKGERVRTPFRQLTRPSALPHAAPAIAEAFGEKTAHAGDAVVVHGLTSEAGQRLNGMRATVVRLDLKKGRFLVALQPSGALGHLHAPCR